MTSPSVCLCFTTIWKYSFFSQELVLPSGFYDSRFLLFTGVQKRDLVFFFSNRKCLSMKAVHSCYLKTVLGTTPCAKDSQVNNSCCRDNPSRVEKVRSNPSEEVTVDSANHRSLDWAEDKFLLCLSSDLQQKNKGVLRCRHLPPGGGLRILVMGTKHALK